MFQIRWVLKSLWAQTRRVELYWGSQHNHNICWICLKIIYILGAFNVNLLKYRIPHIFWLVRELRTVTSKPGLHIWYGCTGADQEPSLGLSPICRKNGSHIRSVGQGQAAPICGCGGTIPSGDDVTEPGRIVYRYWL